MTPALHLPGDWSSPRLLIRILYTIGSGWELGEAGLVERSTGRVATVSMGPPDDGLPDRMRAGDDPVYPSLTDERLAAVAAHKAVVEVRCADELEPRAACRLLLSCGAALIDAGAHAVWVASGGLAHGPERWQELARAVAGDEAVAPGSEAEDLALYRAFVRPIVRKGPTWRTAGLAQLGESEVVVDGEVAEPYAYDVLDALGQRLVAGPGLQGGEILQPGRTGPRMIVERGADPDAADGEEAPMVWRVRPTR